MERAKSERGRRGFDRSSKRHAGAGPALSDAPPAAAPPPHVEDVVPPPPVARNGGIENIPEELLTKPQRLDDELNHAGMDIDLPGESDAPVEAAEEHADHPSPRHEAPLPEPYSARVSRLCPKTQCHDGPERHTIARRIATMSS